MNHFLIKKPEFCSSQDADQFYSKMGSACSDYGESIEGIVAYIYDHKLERLYKLCSEYETSYEKIDPLKAATLLKKKKLKATGIGNFQWDIGDLTPIPAPDDTDLPT